MSWLKSGVVLTCLQSAKKTASTPAAKTSSISKPNRKPMNPVFLYRDEHKQEYMKKHPTATDQEVSKHFIDEFNKLPIKQKVGSSFKGPHAPFEVKFVMIHIYLSTLGSLY